MYSIRAYIALNSNLNDPLLQLTQAVQSLGNLPQTELQKVSRFYQNPPMGPQDQPDFINAVAALDTCLEPIELLAQLQCIETQQGRKRDPNCRWGERNLDLDILLYGDQCIESEILTLPHPGLMQRYFFLFPLYEIAPDLRFPSGELLASCLPYEKESLLVPIEAL